jgi:hypothetical protein
MELHPTPESWRIALLTAIGALGIALGAATMVAVFGSSAAVVAAVVIIAALATFAPAVGAMSAAVDADVRGVTIRRFGRTSRYAWSDIVDVRLVERRASVPDGTEYHWVVPSRSRHVVAVPCLELADGRVRQLPALAAPATGPRSAAAREHAAALTYLRGISVASYPSDQTRAASNASASATVAHDIHLNATSIGSSSDRSSI